MNISNILILNKHIIAWDKILPGHSDCSSAQPDHNWQLGRVQNSHWIRDNIASKMGLTNGKDVISIYVMIFLIKTGLCIKVIFMYNSCLFNYYDKCYVL